MLAEEPRMLKRFWISLRRIGPVLWQTLSRFEGTERRRDAAALTYTTLFALVPVLTVIYAILSAIPALHEWGGEINAEMLSYVMPEGSEQISEYLIAFSQQARRLTWVGVVFLFITSLTLLRTIEIQFNKIWNVDKPRSGLQTFFRYWAVLTLGPVFIIGAFAASSLIVSLPLITNLESTPFIVRLIPWLFSSAALTAMYMLVPNCRVPWRNAVIAAVIVALFLEVGKFLFARIIGMFPSYKLIYGAFAAVPLFLLWTYMAWMLLLLGAELSYALSHYAPKSRKMPTLWRRILLVHTIVEQQEAGRLLSERELVKLVKELTPVQVRVGLQQLQQQDLVALTQEGQWVWLPNIQQFTIAELLQDMTISDLKAPLPEDIRIDEALRARWLAWQKDRHEHSQMVMGVPLHTLL